MSHLKFPASCSCADVSGRCVMAAVSGFPVPLMWSSCSTSQLQSALTREQNNLGRCLENEPSTTVGDPVCGNGIREGDEICDCGSVQVSTDTVQVYSFMCLHVLCVISRDIIISLGIQECADPCCDATTCGLAVGAECTKGECCTNTCQFKSADTVCRASSGNCDIKERCTGQSADCPADVYLQDGSSCNNNQAFCFSGQCRTYNTQCQKHFRTSKHTFCINIIWYHAELCV